LTTLYRSADRLCLLAGDENVNALLTRPQKEKMLEYLHGIGQFLRENRQAPTAVVIEQLIPVIRGWSAYYRHGASSRAFSYADYRLWMMLWSWAKPRHPTKSLVWVKRLYSARGHGTRSI
jgi:RNA-directed DNA polymerase